MEKEIIDVLKSIENRVDLLAEMVQKRFEALKNVVYSYLEAGSSIALASVKANLKNV